MVRKLKTSNLVIGYGKRTLLSLTDLEIPEGCLIALAGANGSGKTTLMKTLAGLIPKLQGEIFIEGKPIHNYSDADLSKLRTMYSPALESSYNYKVKELLEVSRFPYTNWLGHLKDSDLAIIDRSLKITGISHLASRNCFELSDGEKQKLHLARAYCQDTGLIFLDEPFVHLDIRQKQVIFQMISMLVKVEKKSIVLATHDMEFITDHADRVISIYPDKRTELLSKEEFKNKIKYIFDLVSVMPPQNRDKILPGNGR